MDQEAIDTANTPLPDEVPVNQSEPKPEPAAQPADSAPAPEGTTQPDTQPQDTPKKGGVQKRIDELTRERYEAQRQADHWRQVAEQRAQAVQQQQAAPPPKIEDYQDVNQFLADRDNWIKEQTKAEILREANEFRRRQQQEEQQHQQVIAQQQRVERFVAQEAEAVAKYQDYLPAVSSPQMQQMRQTRPDVIETIIDSDHGPDIAYFLAKNPAQMQRITSLPHLAAVREIGRIEQMFMAPAKQTTQAPDPVRTVGGKAEVARNPDNMTLAEYRKWRTSQSRN